MGARHSTPGNGNDASSSSQAGSGLVAEHRVPADVGPSYSRRSNVDGAGASEPGPSRASDGTSASGAGRGVPKHRARHVPGASEHRRLALDVLAASGAGRNAASGSLRSAASNDSTPDDSPLSRMLLTSSSFPLHIFAFRDVRCPVCHKMIPADDVECHLVMCLTKPRITYNEDVLVEDKEECIICLDELRQGDTIARLPCLCIYHKSCIDDWFKVNRTCPEHPDG